MSEENIVEYCAPTLAGIKTANLFSCAYHDRSEVLEDVKGFIEHKGECSKCVGCWKVYGDVKKAVDTFDRYTKCTTEFKKRFSAGVGLEKLAVAI
ncbi:MAG: DUF3793 family protein [Eubacterium sp.]|nr:DUF3793 family protein [Eubacterium sp.]